MMGMPADGLGLTALVFLLGLRHGFDPDHLIAIDGLARSSKRDELRRWNGVFFSLGHGVVVTLVGLAVALAASARHRSAIATLMARETRSARRSAPRTIFATHQPFSPSVTTMPRVKTRPSRVAKSHPAIAAPVSEKASAWLIVSNESAKAAPIDAMNMGWPVRPS